MLPQNHVPSISRTPLWFPPISSQPKTLSALFSNELHSYASLGTQDCHHPQKAHDISDISDSGEGSDLSPSASTDNQNSNSPPLEVANPSRTRSLFIETEFVCPKARDRSPFGLNNCDVSSDSGRCDFQLPLSLPRRNCLYPLQTARVLTSPYQSFPVAGSHVYLYTWTLPTPDVLAKLAAVHQECFTHTEQAFGLLFSKPISKSDYVCRIPLYLTRGMARARVRLLRQLILTDDQLELICSVHHIIAELLTNIADLSHVGLRHTDLRLHSDPVTVSSGGISVRNAYTEMEFEPVASRTLCLVCLLNIKTGELDLVAAEMLLKWSLARRDCCYESCTSYSQPVHGVVSTYPVRLSQIPVCDWAGLMVRPCHLAACDPAMFALSGPSQKTGLDPVPIEWAKKLFNSLGEDESVEPVLSYADYFAIRHPSILDLTENLDSRLPLASCFRLTRHQNAAQAVAGMRKDRHLSMHGSCALYLADACAVHPLSAWLWFLMSIIPVVLYQLTRAVTASELSDLLVLALRDPSAIRPTVAHTVLLPDRIDKPRCMLSELTNFTAVDSEVNASTSLEDQVLDERASLTICDDHSSRPADLLEATTLLASRDAVNLERLELLGDSFLQLIGTLTVYSGSPSTADEGYLTAKRVSLVSNANLCNVALRLGWAKFCTGQAYSPPNHFLFPCYSLPSSATKFDFDSRTHIKLTDKALADMMEALIGCLHQHLGIRAAFRLICFFGISPDLEQDMDPIDGAWSKLCCSVSSPPISSSRLSASCEPSGSSTMFHFNPPTADENSMPITLLNPCATLAEVTQRFKSRLIELQNILGYHFNDIKLLIQAVIHPSSPYTEVFGSYQRLEFLGDAVLGYIITVYLYSTHVEFDPEKLTESRANIVSNNSLACAVVGHKIHPYICHCQPSFNTAVSYLTKVLHQTNCFSEQLELLNQAVLKGLRVKTLADVFEAIIGAAFVDTQGNLNVVAGIIHRLLDDRIHDYLEKNPINPLKSLHRLYPDLKYTDVQLLNSEGTSSRYKLCATVSGERLYTYGATRDEARLALAQQLRIPLKSIDSNQI